MNQNEFPWTLAEGELENGKPFILRFREFYPTEVEQNKYCFLIEITWQYEITESGMPSETLHEKMFDFEDILDEEIESKGICLLMTSITGGGKKIWHFYSTDADLFINKLNEVLRDKEVLPLKIEIYEDEKWNAYKEIISGVKE